MRITISLLILVAIIALAAVSQANALTGPESRFDWSLAQPSVAANATSNCTNQATARFDWSLGIPAVVYDATATCATAVVANPSSPGVVIRAGIVIIRSGTVIVQ